MRTKKGKRLTKSQYWEYRCTIEERDHVKAKAKLVELRKEYLLAKIEIARLQYKLFIARSQSVKAQESEIDTEYKNFVADLEDKVGFKLKDVEIDPYSFEVKQIKQGEQNGSS